MTTSLLLLLKFAYDIVRRLIHDAYYRALGTVLLMMVAVGTLFFWLVEGRTFLQALAYSALTMAMNSPYGSGWGPESVGGIVFNIVYLFFGVGLFLLFVLETGKTMVKSHEELLQWMADWKARRKAGRQPNSQP
jgi:hypothetical protein